MFWVGLLVLGAPHREALDEPGASGWVPKRSNGCGKAFPVGVSSQFVSIDDPLAGLISRRYRIFVPRNYDPFQPVPLVVDFHGYYNTAEDQEEATGFKRIADERDFIVVWPQGLDDTVIPLQDAYSWNAGGVTSSPGRFGPVCNWTAATGNYYPCHKSCRSIHGCRGLVGAQGCDCGTCANDMDYTARVLDKVEETLCIDQRRIHASGMSMGSMMVYTVASTPGLGERFASIAPVAGSMLLGFLNPPVKPMAVLDIHGTTDDVIPSNISNGHGEGAEGTALSEDGYYYHTTTQVLQAYSTANQCSGEPVHYRTPYDGASGLYCWAQYGGSCKTGQHVIRCSWEGGHTWPFEETFQGKEHFARLVWDFFVQNLAT